MKTWNKEENTRKIRSNIRYSGLNFVGKMHKLYQHCLKANTFLIGKWHQHMHSLSLESMTSPSIPFIMREGSASWAIDHWELKRNTSGKLLNLEELSVLIKVRCHEAFNCIFLRFQGYWYTEQVRISLINPLPFDVPYYFYVVCSSFKEPRLS